MSLLTAALAVSAMAAAPASGPAAEPDLRAHLRDLQQIADRHGGTRAAGTPGERDTIALVERRMREAGWQVRRTRVTYPFFEVRGTPRLGDLRRPRDFEVLQHSGSGTLRAPVRALDGQGCTEEELAPVARDAIVLVARGTCTFRIKARSAERAGARALLVVDRRRRAPVPGTLGDPGAARIPVLSVTPDAARRLAAGDRPVDLQVRTTSERRATSNVVAETAPGPDGRTVMAGAHHDSVEEGPGLNDNGSGVAALLAIAPRLADRPGLRFGFWAAEEPGLFGSRAYVRSLGAADRRRIGAYVNLDMVGSPKPRPQVYDTDDRVERVLREAVPGEEGETSLGGASDHAPFRGAGIPVGGLFTGASRATDPCYHRRCDDLGNVDVAMATRMARATERALRSLGGR